MFRWIFLVVFGFFIGGSPAQADWLRAESDHFIVYGEVKEQRLRSQVEILEEFDQLLRAITGTSSGPSSNKLTVYLVKNNSELNLVRAIGRDVAGFYSAGPDAVMAVVDETANRGSSDYDTLFHEYAHHFMLQYRPAAYPPWYVEGFAEYVMTADITPERIEYGKFNKNRASWLADRRSWIPFEKILLNDPDVAKRDPARYYAQS